MRSLTLIFLLIVFASSCTIQKRLHRPGWHVSWNKSYKGGTNSDVSENSHESTENESTTFIVEEELEEVSHSVNNNSESCASDLDIASEIAIQAIPEQTSGEKEDKKEMLKKNSNFQKILKKAKSAENDRTIPFVSIALIILALIAIAAAVYTITTQAETSDEATAKIFRSIFLLIAAGVLFLLAAISYVVQSSLKKHSEEKDKNEETLNEEELKKKEASDTKASVKAVIAIATVFVLLVGSYLILAN